MTFRIAPQDEAEFIRGQMENWRQVRESECFDIDHIEMPLGTTGLRGYNCEREDLFYPYCVIVERYARFGLHRYNMSQGTNFQLHHLKKFNMTMNCLASYYITLAACDPTTTSSLNFQVEVVENGRGRLNLTCFIARPQGTPSEPLQLHGYKPVDVLPDWPSDFNDTNPFDEIDESELESNDWIRLYLELALCTDDSYISESELSQLQIIKVAIESTEQNVTDQAKNINVYIMFKGLAVASIGEDGVHVERKVIVRRIINEGYFTLLGGYGFSIGEVATRRYITRTLPRPRPRPSVPGEDRPPRNIFFSGTR